MSNNKKLAAVSGGPSKFDHASRRDRNEGNSEACTIQAFRRPIRKALLDALTDALADVEPAERPQILQWVASRGSLGFAHERGFAEAAALGYQMADALAVAVR